MSEHNHDCPDCGGYFACNRDDCDASILCLECQVKELTVKLGKLATDNLKAQHDAAIENTRLRSELAKAREDTEKAREERNHVRVDLQREENKEITRLTAELAKAREELNRWKQSAEEVLRVASAKEEQDGKAN